MVHAPDKIKLIDGSRETLKLAVRITDLWFFGIPNKSEQAEMVIVDSDVWFYCGLLTNLHRSIIRPSFFRMPLLYMRPDS